MHYDLSPDRSPAVRVGDGVEVIYNSHFLRLGRGATEHDTACEDCGLTAVIRGNFLLCGVDEDPGLTSPFSTGLLELLLLLAIGTVAAR
jgi:hypothetical protein